MMKRSTVSNFLKRMALVMAAILILTLLPMSALAEENSESDDWVTIFLLCNEGMTNEGGNTGNTIMVVAMNPDSGTIRLMMFAWDTFVQYEGYDYPQLISTPYRNNGPEGTMEVFNTNFDMDIQHYMSLNYLNLASMIDEYGGVNVDISRAERNALNGMVASKTASVQKQADSGLLSQAVVEMLAQQYYLNEYGPNTHLNGLQAVGYGWLQYDSVYNCCLREANVNADLFDSISKTLNQKVVFYTDSADYPEEVNDRRVINLDDMTDDDIAFLRELVDPIFQMSYNNLTEEEIVGIGKTLARVAYQAARQGVNIFESLETAVFPLEAENPYDIVAGTEGHLVDYEANSLKMKEFLFAEREEE